MGRGDNNGKTVGAQTHCGGLGPERPDEEVPLTLPSGSLGQVHSACMWRGCLLTVRGNCHSRPARLHTSLVADFRIPFSSLARAVYPLTLSSLGSVVLLLSGTTWQ